MAGTINPQGLQSNSWLFLRRHFMDRVMIFIDGSNLYHSLKDYYGRTDIDIEKLSLNLCGERKLIRTLYYIATVPREKDLQEAEKQQKFIEKIRKLPYIQVRLGRLEKRGNAWVEKGVDIMLASDMLMHAFLDNYDVATLVSSDGDFSYVVEIICDRGKNVENVYVPGHRAYHLNVCDRHIDISDLIDNCWLDK